MIYFASALWNVFLIGGCCVLIERGWSPWWLVLAIGLTWKPSRGVQE